MSQATIKLVDLAGILGGVLVTYYGIGYVLTKFPLSLHALPTTPPPGRQLNPAAISGPRLMTEDPLPLVPGRRYGVALDTPALAPISDNMVKSAARDLGFTNVDVFNKPPPGWPGNKGKSKADTWVVAFYAGAPKTLPRSESGVDVIEAWEG